MGSLIKYDFCLMTNFGQESHDDGTLKTPKHVGIEMNGRTLIIFNGFNHSFVIV